MVEDLNKIRCRVCEASLSGVKSMEEHLAGEDHFKNVQLRARPPVSVPAPSRQQPSPQGLTVYQPPVSISNLVASQVRYYKTKSCILLCLTWMLKLVTAICCIFIICQSVSVYVCLSYILHLTSYITHLTSYLAKL